MSNTIAVPAWFDAWGTVSDLIVAIAAVIGVAVGLVQLARIARSNANQVNIARAELMLAIDKRFESSAMWESRLASRTLLNHCERKARTLLRAGATDEEVMRDAALLFSEEVSALYQRFKTADARASGALVDECPINMVHDI